MVETRSVIKRLVMEHESVLNHMPLIEHIVVTCYTMKLSI